MRIGSALCHRTPEGARGPPSVVGDLCTGFVEDVPLGAELIDVLPGDVAGRLVADKVIERVAPVRHLGRSVASDGGADQAAGGAGAGLWGAVAEVWRPGGCAWAVACRLAALVRLEQIEVLPWASTTIWPRLESCRSTVAAVPTALGVAGAAP